MHAQYAADMPNGPVFHVPTSCLDGRGGPPAHNPTSACPLWAQESCLRSPLELWHWASLACAVREGKQISHAHCDAVARAALPLQLTNCRTNCFKHSKGGRHIQGFSICSKQFPSCDVCGLIPSELKHLSHSVIFQRSLSAHGDT